MDRQEPKLGDLTNIEFRPKSYRGPSRPPQPNKSPDDNTLIWKIAIGVFVGLSLFGLVTCSSLAMIGAAAQKEQEKAIEEITKQMQDALRGYTSAERQFIQQQEQTIRRNNQQAQRRQPTRRPLDPGERCIKGERFKRLENGWAQLPKDPC